MQRHSLYTGCRIWVFNFFAIIFYPLYVRRRDELIQALQEISVEDRKRDLENCRSELKSIEQKLKSLDKTMTQSDRKLSEFTSKVLLD